MLVALLLACVAVALAAPRAMSAGAATGASGTAEPLWRLYPLEQTATTPGGSTMASTVTARQGSSRSPAPERGGRSPWVAMLLTAIAVVLSAASLAVGHRSSATRARAGLFDELEPSVVLAGLGTALPGRPAGGRTAARAAPAATREIAAGAREGSAVPEAIADAPGARAAATDSISSPSAAMPEAPGRRAAVSETPPDAPNPVARAPQHSAPAFADVAPTLKPRRIPTRAADETAARAPAAPRSRPRAGRDGRAAPMQSASAAVTGGQPPPARKAAGPICQIRWLPNGRGSCFSAVTTDGDGVDRTVATSPHVEWHASTPPEETREAQAALRRLSKTLRDTGWRPMRTKGKDFNEPQWYARRFRYPEASAGIDPSAVGDRRARVS
jgi:hypothetical protein